MDFARMGVGRAPQAEYPDGYLGTIRSRRDDKGKPYAMSDTVLDSLKNRQNQRAYQRGVHKGERIDPASYMWPENLEPDRRLKPSLYKAIDSDGSLVMMAKRNVPQLALDGKIGPLSVEGMEKTGKKGVLRTLQYRDSRYRTLAAKPHLAKFLKGWLNRNEDLTT
jgi:hypothetical protein